jgi:uncharacterized membrane protein YhaH (DUF805 family)
MYNPLAKLAVRRLHDEPVRFSIFVSTLPSVVSMVMVKGRPSVLAVVIRIVRFLILIETIGSVKGTFG